MVLVLLELSWCSKNSKLHWSGNTFAVDGETIDVSIAGGGGGGGLGTAINYADGTTSPFSYIDRTTTVTENLMLDTTQAGVI